MFLLKSYSRKELAIIYFPGCSAKAAYFNFRRYLQPWEAEKPELFKAMYAKKVFPVEIVEQIIGLLGEP